MFTIDGLVAQARQDGASDIHIICGLPPKYRRDGQIENMSTEVLDAAECVRLSKDLAGEEYKTFEEVGELDLAGTYAGSRCRSWDSIYLSKPSWDSRETRSRIST